LQDGNLAGKNRMTYGSVRNPATGESYPDNECVLDKVTGLVWEGKNGQPDQPRYGGALFTRLLDGSETDVSGHLASVNASRLCGYSDWRLPSRMELHSLMDYGRNSGLRFNSRFINTGALEYWTSDLYYENAAFAWVVDFEGGSAWGAGIRLIGDGYGVRLVRGNPLGGSASRFEVTSIAYGNDAANNVVNDRWTGLQWRRCAEGRVWNGIGCDGGSSSMSHEAALDHARSKPGWRLPNIKELSSLSDLRSGHFDPVAFPGAPDLSMWASTPAGASAWAIAVVTGEVFVEPRGNAFPVRLVRSNERP
jgi:hypothetical protein